MVKNYMKYLNIIELDIWSRFGCFTKGFATSGGVLTYIIPPKTSLIGMIGAVLGINYDECTQINDYTLKFKIEDLYDIKISVQPLFDLKSKRVTFNQVNNSIINVHQDVLINPYYKLFISFPENLKEEEKVFIERIKNKTTIYTLYMGRNEFPLNYELKNIFPYESKIITQENINDFFKDKVEIHGSLNRTLINKTNLVTNKKNSKQIILSFNKKNKERNLQSYFEYIIKDYPVKRENFSDFTFSTISFYGLQPEGECYFDKFELKKSCEIELSKIGENKWINMI
jgi:CRISPR-associated protein Cas5h